MFINYKGTNVHAIGFSNSTASKLNQSPQEVKGLQPGWNEISKHIWEQNKNQPDIKKMLEKGKLEILPDQVFVKAKDKKTKRVTKKKIAVGQFDVKMKLSWFEEKRAIAIIKDTYNRDILQRWSEEETRIKARKALMAQLKPLLNTEKDEDGDDADSDSEDFADFE